MCTNYYSAFKIVIITNQIADGYQPIPTLSTNPSVHVSFSGKSRNNPIGNPSRPMTRSPVDFRQGRRASDTGLVAQGILSHSENIAFNSQRLHEVCKAKGFLELHLLQKEAANLSLQYQSYIPQEELNVRQREHSQFQTTPIGTNSDCSSFLTTPYEEFGNVNKAIIKISSDISSYAGTMRNDLLKSENCEIVANGSNVKTDLQSITPTNCIPKPPLQQQLMQHRLHQLSTSIRGTTDVQSRTFRAEKRQILQKQTALEACLSRRQMLRQQSYKIAQNQQVLPPLPSLPTEVLSAEETQDFATISPKQLGYRSTENQSSWNGMNHNHTVLLTLR